MSLRAASRAPRVAVDNNAGNHQRHSERDYNRVNRPSAMLFEDDHDDISSVDIPRHNSNQHLSFRSFEHPSHLDSEVFSRHGDEDSLAMDPEFGLTMSTAAHHASALTINAGLGGRHRSPSRANDSRAEFDPERPLQPMLSKKLTEGMSMFDTTNRSRSKSFKATGREQRSRDPIIVDSNVDLDRYLQTGHRLPSANNSKATYPYQLKSRSHPDPTLSEDSDDSPPRLSKVLSSNFSPKRPRSTPAQSFQAPPPRPSNPTPSRPPNVTRSKQAKQASGPSNLNPLRHERRNEDQENIPPMSKLPRTNRIPLVMPGEPIVFDPEHDNESTPRAGSKMPFSTSTPTLAHSKPSVFANIGNRDLGGAGAKDKSSRLKPRVHLPDVTGITSAVQTPIKGGPGYRSPDVGDPSLAGDLVTALDALQNRLQTLEREHGVSRRRVRELELDLEECKAEAARERTRILNKERDLGVEAHMMREREKTRHAQERMREEEKQRYRQIVEEKKSLESFVSTMRNHMSRLTSELALHQSLIEGLRADAKSSNGLESEVQTLRTKVERLAGEVERLKSFVEDGVRERQRAKEASRVEREEEDEDEDRTEMPSQVGIDITYASNPLPRGEEEECEHEEEEQDGEYATQGREYHHHEDFQSDQDEGYGEEGSQSLHEAIESEPELERSFHNGPYQESESEGEHEREPSSSHSNRFIDDSELARVAAEMRERRSERSGSVARSDASGSRHGRDSGHGSSLQEGGHHPVRDASPIHWSRRDASPLPRHTRFTAPPRSTTPARPDANTNADTVPFPNFRGSRIERLFNSAPDHDERSCPACMRQQQNKGDEREPYRDVQERLKDLEGLKEQFNGTMKGRKQQSAGHAPYENEEPQVALTRVITELEDDFTHYKGVYLDLAHQYGVMDPVSNVAKRNILANHLRWIIDLLERIGDHIATLNHLKSVHDPPRHAP